MKRSEGRAMQFAMLSTQGDAGLRTGSAPRRIGRVCQSPFLWVAAAPIGAP